MAIKTAVFVCEDCKKEIRGKPVIENGITFYCFKCYYAEEIRRLGDLADHLYTGKKI